MTNDKAVAILREALKEVLPFASEAGSTRVLNAHRALHATESSDIVPAGSIGEDAEFVRLAENWAYQSRLVFSPEAWKAMCERIDAIIKGASK